MISMLTVRDSQMGQMAESSPNQQMIKPCDDQKTWVEVELVDENNKPVPNRAYRVKLPDGSVMTGNLDDQGKVRFDSIIPGTCQIEFPDIHLKEWQPA